MSIELRVVIERAKDRGFTVRLCREYVVAAIFESEHMKEAIASFGFDAVAMATMQEAIEQANRRGISIPADEVIGFARLIASTGFT